MVHIDELSGLKVNGNCGLNTLKELSDALSGLTADRSSAVACGVDFLNLTEIEKRNGSPKEN